LFWFNQKRTERSEIGEGEGRKENGQEMEGKGREREGKGKGKVKVINLISAVSVLFSKRF
jgi:hypothetical protein